MIVSPFHPSSPRWFSPTFLVGLLKKPRAKPVSLALGRGAAFTAAATSGGAGAGAGGAGGGGLRKKTMLDLTVGHGRNRSRTFYIVDLCRGAHKIFIQELHMSIQKNLHTSAEGRQDQDLLRGISSGAPQDLLTRTCTRSQMDPRTASCTFCKPAQSKWTCHKINFRSIWAKIYRKKNRQTDGAP